MAKKRKKRKKINFHELRYPKNDHHSKILEQHEKVIQEAQYQEQWERFRYFDRIKYAYEVATGIIGRWLSILSKHYTEEIATYNLAEAFLLEVAISEFVFLTNTAEVRDSKKYKESREWLKELIAILQDEEDDDGEEAEEAEENQFP